MPSRAALCVHSSSRQLSPVGQAGVGRRVPVAPVAAARVEAVVAEEPVAVGVCAHLDDGDTVVGAHRPHHFAIAKGVPHPLIIDEDEMYGEFFDIPVPDELVFISWFKGGEVFGDGPERGEVPSKAHTIDELSHSLL